MIDLKRVLLFGATGQLGRALCARGALGVTRAEVDLRDTNAVQRVIRNGTPQAVINAAAYTNVDGAEAEEEMALAINCDAPVVMARTARSLKVPFVHVSTDYVFDGSGTEPWKVENTPQPLNAYGRSKLAGERAVLAANGQAVIVRTSWVFSAHGQNFLRTMLRLAETHRTLRIVDDQIGGPTPAAALAEACIALCDGRLRDAVAPGIYHYAGAPDVSWADFADEIFRVSGADMTIERVSTEEYGKSAAARPGNSRLDCSAFEHATGLRRADWRVELPTIIAEAQT
ncbi:MAG: dTDP-4-dehydrorhamnose reductase [Pseudomonadota bacterium]